MSCEFPNPLSRKIFEVLLEEDKICVIDAGASGGGEFNRWNFLGKSLELYGFEPDEVSCANISAEASKSDANVTYSTTCIGKTEKARPLIVTKDRFSASFLPLDEVWYSRKIGDTVNGQAIRADIAMAKDKVIPTDCISMDQWAEDTGVKGVDFLKIDIEGIELEAMEVSPNIMDSVLGVSVDVIFHVDWIGAPTFSDIDVFLRKKGFYLWDISGVKRNHQFNSPFQIPEKHKHYFPQIACANGIYFRDPLADPDCNMSKTNILKLASIAEVHGMVEYAFELLVHLAEKEDNETSRLEILSIVNETANAYNRRISQDSVRFAFIPLAEAIQKRVPVGLWQNVVLPIGRGIVSLLSLIGLRR